MTEIDKDLRTALATVLNRHGAVATRKAINRLGRQLARGGYPPGRRGKKPALAVRLRYALAAFIVGGLLRGRGRDRDIDQVCTLVAKSDFWSTVVQPPARAIGASRKRTLSLTPGAEQVRLYRRKFIALEADPANAQLVDELQRKASIIFHAWKNGPDGLAEMLKDLGEVLPLTKKPAPKIRTTK